MTHAPEPPQPQAGDDSQLSDDQLDGVAGASVDPLMMVSEQPGTTVL